MSATARSTEQSPHSAEPVLRPSVRQLARDIGARVALDRSRARDRADSFSRRVEVDRQRLDTGRRRCVLRYGPGRYC